MIRTSQRGQGGNRAKDVRGPEVEGGEEEQQSERWIKCEQEGGEGCEAEMWQKRQRGGINREGEGGAVEHSWTRWALMIEICGCVRGRSFPHTLEPASNPSMLRRIPADTQRAVPVF